MLYLISRQEDQRLVEKFGDTYNKVYEVCVSGERPGWNHMPET